MAPVDTRRITGPDSSVAYSAHQPRAERAVVPDRRSGDRSKDSHRKAD